MSIASDGGDGCHGERTCRRASSWRQQLWCHGSAADGGATYFANCANVGFTIGIYYRNSSGPGRLDAHHQYQERRTLLSRGVRRKWRRGPRQHAGRARERKPRQ